MNSHNKKRSGILLLICLVVLLALIVPKLTHADTSIVGRLFGINDIAYSVVGQLAFGVSYVISFIAGVFIAFEAWAVEVLLALNTRITSAPPVEVGFPIALAVANLAFILGIIVIAIATILRQQTYGIKQILWKLIVMAVLVNFSMVIASAILGFADNLTGYFLENINPAGSRNSFSAFATSLAGAFNPQQGILVGQTLQTQEERLAVRDLQGAFSAIGQDLGKLLTPITSLIFVVFSLIFILITLGALAIMLLIRYIVLGILLILMPLAWVTWVFPAISSNWGKWWNTFLRWTFFAPIVVFFLYLGILASYEMANRPEFRFETYRSTNTGAWAAVSNLVTGIFSPVVQQLLQTAIMVGLMLGGLFAANKLSIKGASGAYGMAKGAINSFGGYASRYARRGLTRPLRGGLGQKVTAGLQAPGTGVGRFLRTVTGARYIGRGLEAMATRGGPKVIEEERERSKGMTVDQKIHALSTANAAQRVAWLKEIKDAGRLGEVKNLERYIGMQKEDEFKRYNQGELFKELRGESGLHLKELVEKLNKAKPPEREAVRAEIVDHFRAAPNPGQLADFFMTDKKLKELQEANKMPLGLDPAGLAQMQEEIARGVARGFSPSTLSNFFGKLSRGDQLEKLQAVASKTTAEAPIDVSEPNLRWLNSTGARNLGISPQIFGGGEASPQAARAAQPQPGPENFHG